MGLNIKNAESPESPAVLETTMVLTRRLGQDARPRVFAFLRGIGAEVVSFNSQHLETATAAFLRFGRGRHPAALNFGDCMSYAVASVAAMPSLCTGEDFARTDIPRA
jgi:ribonuclease VapC